MNAKTCSICQTRPVPSNRNIQLAGMSRDMDYCLPCFEEAGWENTHGDGGHEDFESLTVRQTNFRTKVELEAWKAEMREETKDCWICNPELNKAKREYTPRTGTSRLGIVLHVSARTNGTTKAKEAAAYLTGEFEIRKSKSGFTTLKSDALTLVWGTDSGAFQYAMSSFDGKKVRNASEGIRKANAS